MGNDFLKDESPMDMRAMLNFLIVDETEAIAGYDKFLLRDDLSPENRAIFEEIRNDEIEHIAKLTDVYKKMATGAIDPATKEALSDSASMKYWLTYGDWEGSRCLLEFDKPVTQDEAKAECEKRKVLQENIQGYADKSAAEAAVKKMEANYKEDTKRVKVSDSVKWHMHQSYSGYYYFKDSNGNNYRESGVEVRFGSRVPAGEFYISNLFYKYAWGDEAPKVIRDSEIRDYSARGFFNTLGELKSHYSGASLRLNPGGLTVILKSGAELEYSYGEGGSLIFIRGRN